MTEHFGGYLPVVVDVTDALNWETDNVIAVWADNSNDPSYPPAKHRMYWIILILAASIVTAGYSPSSGFHHRSQFENEMASGGLFVSYDKVSDTSAEIILKAHIRNDSKKNFKGVVEYELQQPDGTQAAFLNDVIQVRPGKAVTSKDKIMLKSPLLWSPETPTLYNLIVRIRDNEGNVVDGYRRRIGIRSVEFKGKDGFWLNGKPYPSPLIGANRHQDFAVVGNAVANSIHWRDAKKLRDAGMKVIRNAHCPQDPAFMDACDELGLFVIVNTPGWQFWNDAPEFAQRVYSDIRNLVRRDRNHPCVWLWEPILNETWYPADFAQNTLDIVNQEYPYPYCYSGATAKHGTMRYIRYSSLIRPIADKDWAIKSLDPKITYFTREWEIM